MRTKPSFGITIWATKFCVLGDVAKGSELNSYKVKLREVRRPSVACYIVCKYNRYLWGNSDVGRGGNTGCLGRDFSTRNFAPYLDPVIPRSRFEGL